MSISDLISDVDSSDLGRNTGAWSTPFCIGVSSVWKACDRPVSTCQSTWLANALQMKSSVRLLSIKCGKAMLGTTGCVCGSNLGTTIRLVCEGNRLSDIKFIKQRQNGRASCRERVCQYV